MTTAVRTESYVQLPFLVARTNRVALVQRRLGALDADPGHRWLRGIMADLVGPATPNGQVLRA